LYKIIERREKELKYSKEFTMEVEEYENTASMENLFS